MTTGLPLKCCARWTCPCISHGPTATRLQPIRCHSLQSIFRNVQGAPTIANTGHLFKRTRARNWRHISEKFYEFDFS